MEHRFVKISYTGRVKDGPVFDTTDAETARKEGIFDQNRVYQPVPMVIGEMHVLRGLDEALADMKEGEEKNLTYRRRRPTARRTRTLSALSR